VLGIALHRFAGVGGVVLSSLEIVVKIPDFPVQPGETDWTGKRASREVEERGTPFRRLP